MELKPATRKSLGAIIVGEGFNVNDEGLLTVDKNLIQRDEYIEFTKERLIELFQASKSRRR